MKEQCERLRTYLNIANSFGPLVRSIRKELKMNQIQFSKAFGVTQGFLSMVETGGARLSPETVIKLLKFIKKKGLT